MPYQYNPFTNNLDLTKDISDPVDVSEGGTGDSSFTAYAVIAGGTTSTGPLQSVASVGTSGQVLTSSGAGALPAWADSSSPGMVPAPLFTNSAVWFSLRPINSTSHAITDDRLELTPIFFSRNITLTKIGAFFSGTQAGATTRIGLYTQNPSTGAFTLVSDYGTVDNSAAGLLSINISQNLDVANQYWIAMVTDENGGAISSQGCGTLGPSFMQSATTGQSIRGIYINSVGVGALASSYNFTDFTINISTTPSPLVQGLYV